MQKHTCDPSRNLHLQSSALRNGTIARGVKRWLDLLARSLVSVGIIVMVLMIARGLQDKRSIGKAIAFVSEAGHSQPQINDRQLNDIGALIDGRWHFAGMPWSVKIKQIPDEEATLTIEATLPAKGSGYASEHDSNQVYDILQALHAEISESGPFTLHRINSKSFRVVAFAPRLSPKSIFLVRAVQLLESGKWNLVELQLTSDSPTPPGEEKHLLPIDSVNKRLATRSDASGELIAELIDSSVPMSQLRKIWHSAGWEIGEPQGPLRTLNQSESHSSETDASLRSGGNNEILICSKGDSAIAAISRSSVAEGSQMLLLLRLEK